MHGLGVHVAVIRENEVLLTRRRDYEVWGLPSGEIELGETPAQAAVREVYEETGLNVRLTRLVGLYTIPQRTSWNSTNAVFAAEIIGGKLETITDETIDARFFKRQNLPDELIWWERQRLEDALMGIGGSSVWTQDAPMPAGSPSRLELYQRRDESGLPPADFFKSLFPKGPETSDLEGKIGKAFDS